MMRKILWDGIKNKKKFKLNFVRSHLNSQKVNLELELLLKGAGGFEPKEKSQFSDILKCNLITGIEKPRNSYEV